MWIREFCRRLTILFRRGRFERDLEEEMQFHLQLQNDENRENGMPADDAHFAARRQFGNPTVLKEAGWEMWGWGSVERLLQDLRYALRMLRHNPGFTAVAVLTLALGIGVNVSIFSFIDHLLLRPLPVPDSEDLVSICHQPDNSSEIYESMSYPDYAYYRDHNGALSELAAYCRVDADVEFGNLTEKLAGEIVTANYFPLLGLRPALGRWFAPEEDRVPDQSAVAILSYGLWQRQFGGDARIIGQDITINRRSFTIVGVAPRGFAGLRLESSQPEFWAPIMMYPTIATFAAGGPDLLTNYGNSWLETVGRLKPAVGVVQANTAFAQLSLWLREGPWKDQWRTADSWWKDNPLHWTATLIPANEMQLLPRYRKTVAASLALLGTAVGIVLMVACFNVINLLLARSTVRQREMAVRLAIGAGRARLLRQLATEGLVLSLLGGAVSLFVAALCSEIIAGLPLPFRFPLWLETGLDFRVLTFALLVSVVAGVLFALAPARAALSVNLTSALKVDPGSGVRLRKLNLRNALMVTQAALSVVLLVGAGLFLRTLANARATDITAEPGRVLMTSLNIASRKYSEPRGQAFYRQLLERIEALPGVRRAALVMVVPMGGRRGGSNVTIDTASNASGKTVQVDWNVISPSYFETVGVQLVRGRVFTDYDRGGAPAVAIINEEWARHFWPGQDPLDKRFEVEKRRTVQVIGVVRDGKFRNYRAEIRPCFYEPLAQSYSGMMNLEVRTANEPLSLAQAVRREVAALDKEIRITEVTTLDSYRDAGLGQERMIAGLLTGLGVLALGLAAIGIYGVMSFLVAQRRREIGIRIALGARRGEVLCMVLRQGLVLMMIGLAFGLVASAATGRFITSLLYDVNPADPWTFVTIILVLTATAMVACYIPARRATEVDPMEALRNE